MSNTALQKAVQAAVGVAIEAAFKNFQDTPTKAAPKAKPAKAAKAAPKAPKAPITLKEHAQAALDSGKVDGRSSEAKKLREFIDSKVDGRSAEGRAAAIEVSGLLGLPPPKKPGPAPKTKAEKPAKAAKAPKAAKAEKTPKAPKAPTTVKEHAEAAIEAKKFHHKSKDMAALKAFVASKVKLTTKEGREMSAQVAALLGLPTLKKPDRVAAPKAEKAPKAPKAPKAEKAEAAPKVDGRSKAARATKAAAKSGKGEADSASDASTPSPKKSAGAKPRAIDAVEMVIGTGTMNAAEVLKALEEKGWLPDSTDPKTYVSFILSQNKPKFERDPSKGRGYYRIRVEAGETTPTPPPTPLEAPKATNGSSNGTYSAAHGDLPLATEDDNPFEDADEFTDSVDNVLG